MHKGPVMGFSPLAPRLTSVGRHWVRGLGIGLATLAGACAHAGDGLVDIASLEGGARSSSGASGGDSAWSDSSTPASERSADSSGAVSPAPSMSEPSGGAPVDGGGDAASSAQEAANDATEAVPPSGDAVDASNNVDAGIGDDSALPEAAPQPPPCQQTCETGCCDSTGTCVSGRENTACGTQATACVDCASQGRVCTAHACVSGAAVDAAAPPPPLEAGASPSDAATGDAGDAAIAPKCVSSACANFCPPYFVACCKLDDGCGCALSFPRGPCF